MCLTVNLAGANISIEFFGQAQKAVPLCRHYLEGFFYPDKDGDVKVQVRILNAPNEELPFLERSGEPVFEQLLCTPDVAIWLNRFPEHTEDFPITEATISSYCQGGLLLFNPDSSEGRIFLLNKGAKRFRPVYRLLWIYFSQVLGERGSCFVHAAGLAHDGKGYLFMGESGTGKTTIAKLIPECTVLSDDGPILLKQNGQFRVCPSPYHQMLHSEELDKAFIRMRAKLIGLYFLIKDDQLWVEELSGDRALLMITARHIHFFHYLSNEAKKALFNSLCGVCSKIPSYYLHFRRDDQVWKIIRDQQHRRM
jgi:hypothetical protein